MIAHAVGLRVAFWRIADGIFIMRKLSPVEGLYPEQCRVFWGEGDGKGGLCDQVSKFGVQPSRVLCGMRILT